MQIREQGIERRRVVEFYIEYECAKKQLAVPDSSAWDWASADSIDEGLRRANLKHGIIPGYVEWDLAELTIDDLRSCAVADNIFPKQPQMLSLLEKSGRLATWNPDRDTAWYGQVREGIPLDQTAALILRPAVRSEAPAHWYLEDGSGRAVALVANAARFHAAQIVAVGYRGGVSDPRSSFMRRRFPELLVARTDIS